VPAPPPIDQLDDDVLDEMYDDGSLARGRAYATEDRVRIIESGPGLIRSVCKGSGQATYLVRIRWHDANGGVYLDDDCSCPLTGQCKHCVATLLTARNQAALAQLAELSDPRAPRHLELARPGWPTRPNPTSPVTSDWRKHLVGLDASDAAPAARTPLALQFGVHQPSAMGWGAPSGPTIAIRPMRQGKSGKWVKGEATWRDLLTPSLSPYSPTASLDPLQRSAIGGLATCARITPYSTGPDPTLDRFGPDVWNHLRRVVDTGVELIGDRANLLVELERHPAEVHVDVSATVDGLVVVTAELHVAGHDLATLGDQTGVLGVPPHGAWAATPDLLRLIAFEAPLHPTVARLLDAGPLVVPEHDVDELLDLYLPALSRHAAVASANQTVSFEVSRFDRLLLTVTRTALDAAHLRWSARYRRGERIADHALNQFAGLSRDLDAEAEARANLDLPTDVLPWLAASQHQLHDLHLSGHEVIDLFAEALPWLEANGQIDIEVLGDLPALRAATEAPVISVAVRDAAPTKDGNDWFDLDVTVSVDGELIEFVSLFTALHRGDRLLFLPSGTWIELDRPEFDALRELLEEARSLADPEGDATARINRFQAAWWDELVTLGVVTEQSDRWMRSIGQLRDLDTPEPVAPPAGLEATLRPYQQEGLDWLAFLHRNELGGILADDMGLGKTVQTLAMCLHILERQPTARFLVVAPTSVVENWAREAARFAPGLAVRTIRETQARRGSPLADEVAEATLVVTSYALFRLEFEQYDQHDWEVLLLDEAQFVKNHQGKTHQCARRLDAATKVAITGTPLENSLMDLWSLLSITAPGLYPDPKRFSETYRKPIESGKAPDRLATLRRRIAPLMRRRTKDAVLTELPPKVEQTIEVALSPKHARIYATQLQRQRQKVLGLVGDVTKHRFEILKSLTILRQLALDPGLVDEEHDGIGSAKLDRLMDDLAQVVAEGHRALVFSQFTRYLARVRTRLDAAGIDHAYLDGRTRKRDEAIARFTDGDCPVFVISLKAGGFGLNLTEADYCFVLDPWWNPATETQAVDRAHRIGQQRTVMVYRYVSVDTIEEKVMELKAKKAGLFDRVVGDDGALAGALSETDIRSLLDLG
jgi:superfamily II DNA or RNA helicase